MKYLVYLQSYTSTYALNSEFQKICEECIKSKDVVGLIVGSRPDTLSDEKISFLSDISRESPVFLEIGAETSNNDTLKMINRHHTWEDVVTVVEKAARNNLHCGLHLIAGLPGEDEDQVIRNVSLACDLPIETLKLHQLQILYGTRLYDMWKEGNREIKIYEFEEYLRLCVKLVSIIPDNIVIDRFISQSPPDLVAAPKWGVKNYQFMEILNKTITSKNSFLR